MSSEMQEAIARRGVGQEAPMTPEVPAMAGQMVPQAPQAMPAPQGQAAPAKFEPTDKDGFIITTLAEELKRSHDLKKEQLKFNSPMQ